jgi:DNA-binding transcriptional regulator PaaX
MPVIFTHRDRCWTVVRRSAADLLLFTAEMFLDALLTRGRSLLWTVPDAEHRTYYAAQRRLLRAGLRTKYRSGARLPELDEAPRVKGIRLPPAIRPDRRWSRPWDGTWWVLCYDVPEQDRLYRDRLRTFVKRLGMGRLQQSVFVAPDDIRPEYRDLSDAASVAAVSVLFASRTVLGRRDGDLARIAWDMERLGRRHLAFLETADRVRSGIARGDYDANALRCLREESLFVYLSIMQDDPLLPRAIWPRGYLGEEVYRKHGELQSELMARMLGAES